MIYGISANFNRRLCDAPFHGPKEKPMLQLRPNCECCDRNLPPSSRDAMICTFECTFCSDCVDGKLKGVCPNCGGEFVRRPIRPEGKLKKNPASTTRIHKPQGYDTAPENSTHTQSTITSHISSTPFAAPTDVAARYASRLSFETDCWDVHDTMERGATDFVLLDVRGPTLYEASHVPGAINLPRGKMTERRMSEWAEGTLFVVYCAGPHCNGTDKAALRLALLGRFVKVMIGGMTGWADEGFAFEGSDVKKGV
jgi:rhodanese-related sulfurtransferase